MTYDEEVKKAFDYCERLKITNPRALCWVALFAAVEEAASDIGAEVMQKNIWDHPPPCDFTFSLNVETEAMAEAVAEALNICIVLRNDDPERVIRRSAVTRNGARVSYSKYVGPA